MDRRGVKLNKMGTSGFFLARVVMNGIESNKVQMNGIA